MLVSSLESRQSYSIAQKEHEGILERNEACIIGIIEENLQFSHMSFGQRFYKTRVMVKRHSGTIDFVPIVLSETLRRNFHGASEKGKDVRVTGRFSSNYARGEDGKKHLYLFLYAYTLDVYASQEQIGEEEEVNTIYLSGYISNPPILRKTPSGKDVADIIIAVKRNSNIRKPDYIPCVAWNGIAKYVSQLKVGDAISIQGRIQSREYFKRYSPGTEEGECKIAYEVSIMVLEG